MNKTELILIGAGLIVFGLMLHKKANAAPIIAGGPGSIFGDPGDFNGIPGSDPASGF